MPESPQTPSPSNLPSTTTGSSSSQNSRPDSSPKSQIPSSLSEWQLLAVLQRANLVQYYEIFIAQGGDDINQIMQCDEQEFMEIMSLVGMLSKPLHVRRLQRTLTDFSKDPASFNLAAIQHIGPPPVPTFPTPSGANAMEILLPGFAASLNGVFQQSSSPGFAISESSCSQQASVTTTASSKANTTSSTSSNGAGLMIDFNDHLSSIGATANVLTGDYLQSLVTGASHMTPQKESVTINTANSKEYHVNSKTMKMLQPPPVFIPPMYDDKRSQSPHLCIPAEDFVALGDFDPNFPSTESPVLSEAQIKRLAICAAQAVSRLPPYLPKMVQNKKKISKDLLDLMTLSSSKTLRMEDFRKYSAIYGRFDAKRKPDKCLTLHEVSVNEAAAQICLLQPALLTRRDELFPLARQVVKDAGYHYAKGKERKRTHEDGSPRSTPSVSPPPCLQDEIEDFVNVQNANTSFVLTPEEKKRKVLPEGSYLEKWAAGKLNAHEQ